MSERQIGDPYLVAFGRRVRERRQAAGLSLEDLSESAGVSYRHLSDVERGLVNPTLLWVRRLAAALRQDPSELLSGLFADGT